jgi:two-component sensor histidine kinase
VIKNIKYYLIILLLLSGGLLLNKLLNNYEDFEKQRIEEQLNKAHNSSIVNAKAGIEVYATLVSSVKSYLKNSQTFPTELELQAYVKDLLSEINFKDPIVINFLDKDHVFKYVITPNAIDEAKLKGVSLQEIKPQESIDRLNKLMLTDNITLFAPINLREGWSGFPFNFTVRDKENEVLGYVAPIIDVKYLLDYFYEDANADKYVHKFLVNDKIDLTREVFYDGSDVFNKARDNQYYKNFNVKEDGFIYSNIELFGLKLKVGSAYKKTPQINQNISRIAYAWYIVVSLLILVILRQYAKNKRLNSYLNNANFDLKKNLHKIQNLIKEIHHRVKNNMQMISGILYMQMDEYDDENIKSALQQSQNRIQSMSLVHEKLYGTSSLKDVKIKEYIIQLIKHVEQTISTNSSETNKTIKVDELLEFDADTTSNLGLMINELVTNSFKYAFLKTSENSMSISITKEENNSYTLTYKDSGLGLPDNFNLETAESLGMQLINILTEQLSGTLTYTKTPESTFVINFRPLGNTFTSL